MYDWLGKTLQKPAVVITATRRLARLLQEEYGQQQVAAGRLAWSSPEVFAWHDWLNVCLAGAADPASLPTRINQQHSQILWERCLRKELGDDTTGISTVAKSCRDAWQRGADARLGIKDIARTALSDDHRLFATVAGRYLGILERENWVDTAGLAALVHGLFDSERVAVPQRLIMAGFDREPASLIALCQVLADKGCGIERIPAPTAGAKPERMTFEEVEQEMRAAGAWARAVIEENPSARVAIVKQGLEQTAERDARLVREGAVPGWQYGGPALRNSVNVSYGGRLSDYPAIAIALLALRWLAGSLSSREVAALLLSPLFASGGVQGRSRLELKLRDMPDRRWSPSMITSALRRHEDDESGADWLARVAALSKKKRELPTRASPAEWAILFHEVLGELGWPGVGRLDSESFQLINRWREILNELARLDLVAPSMSAGMAIGRLELMAADTVFQAESGDAAIQLLGPLEAAGAEFDALWLAGMTATEWPPAAHPNSLIARSLQVENNMPDATPADTLSFAEATLDRLINSSQLVVCSYAAVVDDTEQTVSELIRAREVEPVEAAIDPGWFAATLSSRVNRIDEADNLPPIEGETIFGGAGTIERQMSEPFGAFVHGRLGANWLNRQAVGITPPLRGSVLHDALYRLYQELPDRSRLLSWAESDLHQRVQESVAAAFVRHERNTDDVLAEVLKLERRRVAELIEQFVALDCERDDFEVAAVEGELEFRRGNVKLSLRFDRIDRLQDGGISIIDYKTGNPKYLLQKSGAVREPQLFVYAAATEERVAALALVNIDSREIIISGGGQGFSDESLWPQLLEDITKEIDSACADFAAGDVRLDANQSLAAARPLNVLSRFAELSRDR